jgi:hypothetical protein
MSERKSDRSSQWQRSTVKQAAYLFGLERRRTIVTKRFKRYAVQGAITRENNPPMYQITKLLLHYFNDHGFGASGYGIDICHSLQHFAD